jgi:hypothetical protein
MRVFKDLDELKAALGTEIGGSDRLEITQEQIEWLAGRPATTNGFMSILSAQSASCKATARSLMVS